MKKCGLIFVFVFFVVLNKPDFFITIYFNYSVFVLIYFVFIHSRISLISLMNIYSQYFFNFFFEKTIPSKNQYRRHFNHKIDNLSSPPISKY